MKKQRIAISVEGCRIPLVIEQVEDGAYMATSPTLEGLKLLADTVEKVLALAPGIVIGLTKAMHEKGCISTGESGTPKQSL